MSTGLKTAWLAVSKPKNSEISWGLLFRLNKILSAVFWVKGLFPDKICETAGCETPILFAKDRIEYAGFLAWASANSSRSISFILSLETMQQLLTEAVAFIQKF
jgi:hypothetical protein